MIPEVQKIYEQKRKQLELMADSLDSRDFNMSQIPILLDVIFQDTFFDANKDLFYKILNHIEVKVTSSDQITKICNLYKDKIFKQEYIVNVASKLAEEIHHGQVDKSGKDYYKEHLSYVAQLGNNWIDKTVGYLHDAAEDKNYSTEDIIQKLKNKSNGQLSDIDGKIIKNALDLLNSKTSSSRKEYIERLKNNEIAMRVKLNDLYHNMDLSRIKNPTLVDFERATRYQNEYSEILTYVIKAYN